jgi:hypothetical protein
MKIKQFPYNSFMHGWYIPKKFCDDVLKWSEENKDLTTIGGCLSKGGLPITNDNYKKSSDKHFTVISAFNLYKRYISFLNKGIINYSKKYTCFNLNSPLREIEGINFQHYKPGEGFKAWHAERLVIGKADRVMVFMTYLNDVKKGGTEFYNQKLKINAEKGLTLCWPSDWTHTHRGTISNEQDKYILTGWLNYE